MAAVKTAKLLVLGSALAGITPLLQGCGGGGDGEEIRGPPQVVMSKEDCGAKCEHDAMYGRWSAHRFPHLCLDAGVNKVFCECSDSQSTPPTGCSVHDEGSSLASISDAGRPEGSFRGGQQSLSRDEDGGSLLSGDGIFAAPALDGAMMVDISGGAQVSTQSRYTETDTVNSFCDTDGLRKMHGRTVSEDEGIDVARDLETKILGDVARELETNNVDKMAKEIFSFYVCARWVPDAVFWDLARQELASQVSKEVLDGGNLDIAIADMYRKYRFVPMLCSKNLEVFSDKDEEDNTYFRKFKHNTLELADWLTNAATSPVSAELAKVDRTFCDDAPMVSCKKDKSYDGLRRFFGVATEADLTKSLASGFKEFTTKTTPGFQEDFSAWKQRFPYHSFIGKPEEWDAKNEDSPRAAQRFVICFGKRVASELHRRPNGAHILTDQNNIGCHGWYEAAVAGQQLKRMVELWKPPTCQLAEMTYVMKKEIMAKFQEMNERLFDSLPSMINDELEAGQRNQQDFAWEAELPQPYQQADLAVGDRVFVDGMRVGAKYDLCLAKAGDKWIAKPADSDTKSRSCRDDRVRKDVYGLVKVQGEALHVKWDSSENLEFEVNPADVTILPHGWKQRKGWHAHVRDLVAGVNKISDKALALFNSLFAKKQQNLANLMSGSVSKWVVCPVKKDVDDAQLDAQLGVEDEAFKDFQMEAYKSWTGFKKQIPGEKCEIMPADVVPGARHFDGVAGCEINELHANHVEPYTKNDETMEKDEFICPIRPPLSASEQLEILHEKKGMCLLHMTGTQRQQYSWHFQGEFPARRQNDRKPNVPKTEYELVKLIKVPGGDITTEVNFGRYCSLEELKINPRFCDLAEVHNDYSTAEEYAQMLARSVAAVAMKVLGGKEEAQAPLSISASALSESVGEYQVELEKKKTTSDKVKEGAKKAAIWVGENTWDSLRGAGRLLKSSAKSLKNLVLDELRGKGRIRRGLEEQHFGTEKSGELLHALSFQRSIGKSNTTSNSKERFQRYVMAHPCPSFDPARAYALKSVWSEVALRMAKEAYFTQQFRGAGAGVLDGPTLSLQLRGDAARFRLPRSKDAGVSDSVTHKTSVSMKWEQATPVTISCQKVDGGCAPAGFCHKVDNGFFSSSECQANQGGSDGWWSVERDPVLRPLVAPDVTTGLFELDGTHLFGLKMELYCAPKYNFNKQGPPKVDEGKSLHECLKEGVLTNARLRSKEPWRLYFPQEVVVTARFSAIDESRYFTKDNLQADDQTALSNDATEDVDYFKHLLNTDNTPLDHSSTKNRFLGMRSGAGFPKATLSEVTLRPEDVLEALQLIEESYGR